MGYWMPTKEFEGQDVFVIGGGPSLMGFPWQRLRGRQTVGCNSAYRLGVDIIKTMVFADYCFYRSDKEGMKKYRKEGGIVASNCEHLQLHTQHWIRLLPREKWSLSRTHLCFGGNSGCSAASYALLLGARRVYLLGFDCSLNGQQRPHWHDWQVHFGMPNSDVYAKFMKGWGMINITLPKVYPDAEIVNLGPDSKIPYFKRQHWEDVLPARQQKVA